LSILDTINLIANGLNKEDIIYQKLHPGYVGMIETTTINQLYSKINVTKEQTKKLPPNVVIAAVKRKDGTISVGYAVLNKKRKNYHYKNKSVLWTANTGEQCAKTASSRVFIDPWPSVIITAIKRAILNDDNEYTDVPYVDFIKYQYSISVFNNRINRYFKTEDGKLNKIIYPKQLKKVFSNLITMTVTETSDHALAQYFLNWTKNMDLNASE